MKKPICEFLEKYNNIVSKLENETYRNAYDWVQFNTYYRISEETSAEINKAFNINLIIIDEKATKNGVLESLKE